MDAVSIRVPYKNLKQEVELAGFDGGEQRRRSQIHSSSLSDGGDSPPDSDQRHPPQKHCSLMTLILSCTVAAGVQFGWALQLSLLTPYIQSHSKLYDERTVEKNHVFQFKDAVTSTHYDLHACTKLSVKCWEL